MTRFVVLTLFPDMLEVFAATSIIKRAIEKELIAISVVDIRAFTQDKHRRVDFPPYGGGSGMVMSCEPLAAALDAVIEELKQQSSKEIEIIYMSPRGYLLNYERCNAYSKKNANYIIVCGHYEGIDERVIEEYHMTEISIGDYVLTGGELASQVFIDSVARLLPDVLTEGSLEEESHTNGLLEYPQYTKPAVFRGREVPEVLLSGHHKKIQEYRHLEAIRITEKYRPELLNPKENNKN